MDRFPYNRRSSKRDARIELLRLFCCFFVVALHCKPGSNVDGVPSFARYLFSNIIADPVSIFFMITGFFFLNEERYIKTVEKNIKRIFLPMISYIVILLAYGKGFSSIEAAKGSLLSIGRSIITWTPFIHNSGHLWYLYVHLLIIVLSPLIKYLLKQIRKHKYLEYSTLILSLGLFWINDYFSNHFFRCSQTPVTSLLPGMLLVIIGSTVFHIFNTYSFLHKLLVLYCGAFIGINIYRASLLTSGDIQMSDATFSFMGVLCALFLVLFFLSLPAIKGRSAECINLLASFTLGIYIWHVLIMEIVGTIGLRTWFVSLITDGSETTPVYLRYTILYSLFIMVISTIWSMLLKVINLIIKKPACQ